MTRHDLQSSPTIAQRFPRWRGLVVVAALLVTACGSTNASLPPEAVQDSARRLYFQAMQELEDGNFIAATTLFQEVASSPRYVRYAALARLRIGDAYFLQDRFPEAAEVYRGFISQYKSDPNLPYARFRVAQSYFERMPSDWFASPPAYELDQSLTEQAEAELTGFVTTFPTSRFAPEARKMLAETRKMLFDHELYAANFYASEESWRAVAWRLDRAIETYPELGLEDDLVYRMADAYAKSGDEASAARGYGLYLKSFPEGKHHDDVKTRLEEIRKRVDEQRRT
ncbi:MAG: outer membrane protein assembly factor BamD [Myxococcales bacterium]|nr:outer membrane protein assembly factor BamD [Myxococcales bacterium]MCB9731553.1 outer membrane protein assembly factor BamD [Deltaproteobacteria bacterium]